MLDEILDALARPWIAELQVGDIVLFRFPLVDPSDGRELKPRPCLAVDKEVVYGAVFIELMPGTQALEPHPADSDILAGPDAFFAPSTDAKGWRFLASRASRFDSAHAGFVALPDDASPVLGRLDGSAREQLEYLRARKHASRERHLRTRRNRRPGPKRK